MHTVYASAIDFSNVDKDYLIIQAVVVASKGKFFHGQEPPSGESTTTECGVNYQLLAVIN